MTHLTTWETDVWPFHAYEVHDSEDEANRHALAMSREHQCEVAVVPLANFNTAEIGRHHVTTHHLNSTETKGTR